MDDDPFERAVERVYQDACNRLLNERRAGRDGEAYFAAANAIQDAWPDIVNQYITRATPWPTLTTPSP